MWLIIAAVLVLWQPTRVFSQLAVIDAANLTQNTMTALQSMLTTVENVLQTGYMIEELAPTDGLTVIQETKLHETAGEAYLLLQDGQLLRAQLATFSPELAVQGTTDLQLQLQKIALMRYEYDSFAVRCQGLVTTVERILARLNGLMNKITGVRGNKQNIGLVNQNLAHLTQQNAQLQLAINTAERGKAFQRMEEALTIESLRRINTQLMSDYPK